MPVAATVVLFILLSLVLAGLFAVIAIWLREGGVIPGGRSEKVHREILDEIDQRLNRFEKVVQEAERLEAGIFRTAVQAKRVIDMVNASRLADTIKEAVEGLPQSGAEKPPLKVENSTEKDFGKETAQSPLFDTGESAGKMQNSSGDSLANKVLEMHDLGVNSSDIAKELGIGKSEVELLLKFSKKLF